MTILSALRSMVRRSSIDDREAFAVLSPEEIPMCTVDELLIMDKIQSSKSKKDQFLMFCTINKLDQHMALYDEIERYKKADISHKKYISYTINDLFLRERATFRVSLDLDTNLLYRIDRATRHEQIPIDELAIVENLNIKRICHIYQKFEKTPMHKRW
ncbi:nucleoside-triphosphatase [Acrasis kona]|uniref:Nucleoside-triphosphatase n=1 Tax=Acrasis kona TaxID=1008807 RepID=A0AAW2ZMH7_9EUKA